MIKKYSKDEVEALAVYMNMMLKESKDSSAVASFYKKGGVTVWEGTFNIVVDDEKFSKFSDEYLNYIQEMRKNSFSED